MLCVLTLLPEAAHAQDAQTIAARSLPGPDSEWQAFGIYPPNQVMIIRTPATGPTDQRRVEVLFFYSPPDQGVDRIDSKYSVNCRTGALRDDGGTVWHGSEYLGSSPSETNGQFAPPPPESIHAGIAAFACGTLADLGARMKLGPATVYALDWLKKDQQH